MNIVLFSLTLVVAFGCGKDIEDCPPGAYEAGCNLALDSTETCDTEVVMPIGDSDYTECFLMGYDDCWGCEEDWVYSGLVE